MSKLQEYLDDNLKDVNFGETKDLSCYSLGESIVSCRKELGISQKELAIRSGVSQANISRIENNALNPSFKILKKIAKGMNKQIVIKFE